MIEISIELCLIVFIVFSISDQGKYVRAAIVYNEENGK